MDIRTIQCRVSKFGNITDDEEREERPGRGKGLPSACASVSAMACCVKTAARHETFPAPHNTP